VIDQGIVEWLSKEESARRARQGAINFDGRVAIVTGAGGGLGREYALELARRGAKVVVNDFGGAVDGAGAGSKSPADKVVEEILSLGGKAVANYESVATPEGGRAIVDAAVNAFGKVDVVINNAGILRDKTLPKMEPENWDAVMDVHLKGAYNVTRPAFLKMRENGYGRIIFTTSGAGLYGNYGQTNYSAAKLGLVGFMNSLKLEGERHNIRINAVGPIARTRMTEALMPPDMADKMDPRFTVPMVLYLCSEQCPVTGNIYNAGMSYYSRAAVATGPGTTVGDGKQAPTPEEVAAKMAKIKLLDGVEYFPNLNSSFVPMMEAFNPKKKASNNEGPDLTVKGILKAMPDSFLADQAAGVDVVFQYEISGPEGGSWYVAVKDGACEIVEGSHDSPTTTLKLGDVDFVKMMSGELNPMVAFTSGKLKIEGDMMKSQLMGKLFNI
jgi:NAD(P)-dependent dehydrogenase (short-subunit alcohol dehydrogenase family)/putative sterol carrier protein